MAKITKAASRTALGLLFTKIGSQTNVSYQMLSPFKIRVTVPGGFPFEAFNGKGFIRPEGLMRMVDSRAPAYQKASNSSDSFLDFATMSKDYFLFIGSTSMSVQPELYDTNVVKAPVECDVMLDYVGKTSFKLKTTIYIPDVSRPVCENNIQSVWVSIKTRKPAPPPDWWREKYSLGTENGKPLILPRLIVPKGVKFPECQMEVLASDVDPYMHLNWSNCIKYCQDAYVHSEFEKHGESGAENASRNMKFFSISYLNEASVGDKVNVRFWKDSVNSNLFHFQILKVRDVINECSVEFF